MPDAKLCSSCGVVDDECHFLLVCDDFTDLRNRSIPVYYHTTPTNEKAIKLLTTSSVRELHNVALYIEKCMPKRREVYLAKRK